MIRAALVAVLAAVAGACGVTGEASPASTPVPTPVPTLGGVGQLPDTIPIEREPLVLVTRPVSPEGVTIEPVSEQVRGNRVLVIGDSIMASTTVRYGGAMCEALVPLGWAVAVDAEPGRFVDFGNEVLDDRLDEAADGEDWDAAVVHLGSNYRGDQASYAEQLDEILSRLAPRPTLLFTVTEFRPDWAEVNEVVHEAAERYENVTIVDWETISGVPGVLTSDGLHPTPTGVQVLVDSTAAAIGSVPLSEGECLGTSFRDDSGVGAGTTPSPPPRSTSSGGSSSGSSSSSSGGSSGGSGGTPPATDPPVVTDPPATDPPVDPSDPVDPPPATEAPPDPVDPPPATEAPVDP